MLTAIGGSPQTSLQLFVTLFITDSNHAVHLLFFGTRLTLTARRVTMTYERFIGFVWSASKLQISRLFRPIVTFVLYNLIENS